MAEMQIFNNAEFGEIRTTTIKGEPWLVGKDVAAALGYAKPENAIAAHVDAEDKTTTLIQGTGSNYKSKSVIINESGVYALIFGSKLESAKRFKRWVTGEVLPAIRKTGAYGTTRNGDTESFTIKQYPGLLVFQNSGFGEIRVAEIGGEPWYFGVDVARAMGYGDDARQALRDHVDKNDRRLLVGGKDVIREPVRTVESAPSGIPLINEAGLYALILSSKLPTADAFKRWVTGTIIPFVRQNDFHSVPTRPPLPAPVPVSTVPVADTPPAPVVKKREPTFDECLKAAEVVMKCGDDRLPYVLAMLRQYGFEIPLVRRKTAKPEKASEETEDGVRPGA